MSLQRRTRIIHLNLERNSSVGKAVDLLEILRILMPPPPLDSPANSQMNGISCFKRVVIIEVGMTLIAPRGNGRRGPQMASLCQECKSRFKNLVKSSLNNEKDLQPPYICLECQTYLSDLYKLLPLVNQCLSLLSRLAKGERELRPNLYKLTMKEKLQALLDKIQVESKDQQINTMSLNE